MMGLLPLVILLFLAVTKITRDAQTPYVPLAVCAILNILKWLYILSLNFEGVFERLRGWGKTWNNVRFLVSTDVTVSHPGESSALDALTTYGDFWNLINFIIVTDWKKRIKLKDMWCDGLFCCNLEKSTNFLLLDAVRGDMLDTNLAFVIIFEAFH